MSVSEETKELALQLVTHLVDGDVDIMDFHAVVEASCVLLEKRRWPVEVDELVGQVANYLTSENKDFKSFAMEAQRIIDVRMESLNVTGRGVKELVPKKGENA